NVCQVEVVGTCDPGTHAKWTRAGYAHLYMPDLPDWAIRDLGEIARRFEDRLTDVRDDIQQLGARIDGKVSQEVYDLRHEAL
ncbi:hypothetical protein KBZ21_40895, partial [Streptomyces sp. A73]|nr:hypothetical protein [Streptomyces sp. A73]